MPHIEQLNNEKIQEFLTSPAVHATTLATILVDEAGTKALEWDPLIIIEELENSYKVKIPDINRDKLLALVTVLTTNVFTKSLDSFIHICNALNGSAIVPGVFDPVDCSEAAWAITEVALNMGDKDSLDFSDDIRSYMRVILDSENIDPPPSYLSAAHPKKPLDEREIDGEQYSAEVKVAKENAAEVNQYVLNNFAALFSELNTLPVRSRDKKGWEEFEKMVTEGKL